MKCWIVVYKVLGNALVKILKTLESIEDWKEFIYSFTHLIVSLRSWLLAMAPKISQKNNNKWLWYLILKIFIKLKLSNIRY